MQHSLRESCRHFLCVCAFDCMITKLRLCVIVFECFRIFSCRSAKASVLDGTAKKRRNCRRKLMCRCSTRRSKTSRWLRWVWVGVSCFDWVGVSCFDWARGFFCWNSFFSLCLEFFFYVVKIQTKSQVVMLYSKSKNAGIYYEMSTNDLNRCLCSVFVFMLSLFLIFIKATYELNSIVSLSFIAFFCTFSLTKNVPACSSTASTDSFFQNCVVLAAL